MLSNCNTLSVSRLKVAQAEFKKHTTLLVDIRKDIDSVFKRIRTLKSKLSSQYPEAFAGKKGFNLTRYKGPSYLINHTIHYFIILLIGCVKVCLKSIWSDFSCGRSWNTTGELQSRKLMVHYSLCNIPGCPRKCEITLYLVCFFWLQIWRLSWFQTKVGVTIYRIHHVLWDFQVGYIFLRHYQLWHEFCVLSLQGQILAQY